jgi:uncharacterized membrane protein YjjB (DUF3815 family)
LKIFIDFLICIPAAVFFAILFNVPRRAIPASAVLGAIGYAFYEIISVFLGSPITGYFVGTLIIAVTSEILARKIKMPATIFIVPAVIPLVPGIGLYNTMMYLVQGQDAKAGKTGVATFLAIVAMAMALVITTLIFSLTKRILKNAKKNHNAEKQ